MVCYFRKIKVKRKQRQDVSRWSLNGQFKHDYRKQYKIENQIIENYILHKNVHGFYNQL